jgi:hypothetical protein
MAALIRITNRLIFTKSNFASCWNRPQSPKVEWIVRQLTILIAALITFSAIARPHEHHFVPQATGLMPPVDVP